LAPDISTSNLPAQRVDGSDEMTADKGFTSRKQGFSFGLFGALVMVAQSGLKDPPRGASRELGVQTGTKGVHASSAGDMPFLCPAEKKTVSLPR
jgi:hypothetical protein